uniref:Uncharacterized protein n=1 Tax=Pristionchus pacificus TaxID=54126 RepID=A0A2A6CTT4_PRIPA|eukprot:PDM81559.1 hypothetical protein PRIPAC_30540 [Pristionchus pacificus]
MSERALSPLLSPFTIPAPTGPPGLVNKANPRCATVGSSYAARCCQEILDSVEDKQSIES